MGSMHCDGASMLDALYYSRDIYIAVGQNTAVVVAGDPNPCALKHTYTEEKEGIHM